MKAVILVAGSASHLRPFLADRPKALLAVAGIPILRRAITNLLACGVSEFVICTGYLDGMVREAVAEWFAGLRVTYVFNPDFATTGNAHTLALAAPHVQGHPFFLLDGDVVFDVAVIDRLLHHGADALAVRMGGEFVPQEMKLVTTNAGQIITINKHMPLAEVTGESVGLAWLSRATSTALFGVLAQRRANAEGAGAFYEAAFQQLIDEGVVLRAVDITQLFAAEIDTFEDLSQATQRCIAAELGMSGEEYSVAS